MTTKGNVTIMKTVMGAALVCAVFMGCNKDLTEENGGILLRNENNGVVSQAIAPDVWVEEGRLALRDLDVRDSMVNVLAGMTDKDREMMERARGFESAATYYAPYFARFDSVTSAKESRRVAEELADVLRVTWNEDGTFDVDYPFEAPGGYECLVNRDGEVVVGNALYLYKADRRVVIHFPTPEKVARYRDARAGSEEDLVEVVYTAAPMTRAADVASEIVWKSSNGFIQDRPDRKYKWDLVYTCEKVMLDETTFRTISALQLRQEAKKKLFDGWTDYKTKYYVSGDSWVDVSCTGLSDKYFPKDGEQVIERSGEALFTIVSVKSFIPKSGGIARHAHMSVQLDLTHRPNYVSRDSAQVDRTGMFHVQGSTVMGSDYDLVFKQQTMTY